MSKVPIANPGERLRQLLEEVYPPKKYSNILKEIDDDFLQDGNLSDYMYKSTINYLIRRLITCAAYHRKQYPPNIYSDTRYLQELRKYFLNYTRYKGLLLERVVQLLHECLLASDDDCSNPERIRRDAHRNAKLCYICGNEMVLSDKDPDFNHNLITVDHVWPRAMGGLSENFNYKVACSKCNNEYKSDFIDASDFHYELFSFTSSNYQDYRKHGRRYDIPIFAKNDFKCLICDQPAERVGKLHVGRIEPTDSWHFFNLAAYCIEHRPKFDYEHSN